MAGWYELNKHKNEQFGFVLKAGNGEVILTSEQYTTKTSAQSGIASVQVNSPIDARYEKKTASNNSPYFNLKALNGQVIGTSQMYSSTTARDNGIESVKTNGPTTTIKDNT
ncbi:YegP family protein [Methylophilus sp. 3sh_L]|uniref:YegP family protein n=1 Tax=Methylophilus sp. 3sh_L TaxID=3377114 RepID=UPI00398F8739